MDRDIDELEEGMSDEPEKRKEKDRIIVLFENNSNEKVTDNIILNDSEKTSFEVNEKIKGNIV